MAIKVSEITTNRPISLLKDIFEALPSGKVLSLSSRLYQLLAEKWEGGEIEIWKKINKKGWTSGPMVGHVTPNQAIIWAWGGKKPKFRIIYRKKGDSIYTGPVDMNPQKGIEEKNYRSVRGVLKNLLPDTFYEYICYLEGDRSKFEKKGEFKTAPLEDSVPKSFKVAISSCMRRRDDKEQFAVNGIFDVQPDFQFIIGDCVYYDDQADENDPPGEDGIFEKANGYTKKDGNLVMKAGSYWEHWFWTYHIRQRAIPAFARNLRNIPTYSTWDDHDYADDNPDDLPRDQGVFSRKVFDAVWCNPENKVVLKRRLFESPVLITKTTYFTYYNFKRGKDVEFFVLDGRTNLDASKKQMFGTGQLSWLFDKLNESTAIFKILIAGSTVRKWKEFDDFNIIKNILNGVHPIDAAKKGKKIDGLIIITGDIHKCGLREHGKDHVDEDEGQYDLGTPYIIYEIISSGIATPLHYNKESRNYEVRDEAFAFVTLTFEQSNAIIQYHRQDDAKSKYCEWLAENSTNASYARNKLSGYKTKWDEISMSTLPLGHKDNKKTISASNLINAISINKVAVKKKVSGSFRILSDLLKKDSAQSLYAELDKMR